MVDEPAERKRKKRAAIDSYKNAARARKLAALAEFAGHGLEERDGLLFCKPCNHAISMKEKTDVRQHCFGARKKG